MGIWRQGVDFATVIVFGRENTSICMASSFTSEEVKVRNGEKVSAPRNIGFQQNDQKWFHHVVLFQAYAFMDF